MADKKIEKLSSKDQLEMNKSVMNEAKAMATMDGVDNADDWVYVGEFDDALEKLKSLVTSQKAKDTEDSSLAAAVEDLSVDVKSQKKKKKKSKKGEPVVHDPIRWELRGVHLGKGIALGKTLDDVYSSFLHWAQKPEDVSEKRFNITKAYRRLEAFATFQETHFDEFFNEPIDVLAPKFKAIKKYVEFQIPDWVVPDGASELSGCVMWCLDMGKCDWRGIAQAITDGEFEDADMFKGMWGDMLNCMFDTPTQVKGVVIVEVLAGMSIGDMMAANKSMKRIEHLVNELFYQTTPFKMKEVVMIGSPWWLSAMIGLMRMFLSKKMSKRLVNTTEEKMYQRLGGAENLPIGLLQGSRKYTHRYLKNATSTSTPVIDGETPKPTVTHHQI
eukprot:m.134675 g.134675  ORF g.134675 m.134675 type:complete len:386 (+) comp29750_c1_seq4:127-1284(+)